MINVLVPTDFSENAKKALDAVIAMFSTYEANIYLYHAYGAPKAGGSMLISIDDILLKEAQVNMKEELERVKDKLGAKNKIQDRLINGQLQDSVDEIVSRYEIELIVMGTKGASGIQGTLFGSHTINIMRKANVPVIAIPLNSDANFNGKFKMVMGSDQKPFDSINQLGSFLKHLGKAGGPTELRIIYVTETPEDESEQIKNFISDHLPHSDPHFYNVIDKDIVKAIQGFLNEHRPDLFILIQRKNSFISRLIGDSVTQRISMDSPVPLMVLPG